MRGRGEVCGGDQGGSMSLHNRKGFTQSQGVYTIARAQLHGFYTIARVVHNRKGTIARVLHNRKGSTTATQAMLRHMLCFNLPSGVGAHQCSKISHQVYGCVVLCVANLQSLQQATQAIVTKTQCLA